MPDDKSESVGIDRVQDIFLQVVALPAHERQDCLKRLCGADKELLLRLQSLQEFDSHDTDPLEKGLTETLLSACGLSSRVLDDFQVRCPHCHETVHPAEETNWQETHCDSCGSLFSLLQPASHQNDRSNQVLSDRFQLTNCVGQGAFASVFKATDRKLDRVVAIKIPLSERLSQHTVERFLREARSAAQLRHPNIVAVHEVGRDQDTNYIVCDFIDGMTLETSISRTQRPATECVKLIAKIASALEHAHDNGIIHRDLKPSNILLDKNGVPHLTDFGLAKQESVDVTMTIDGQVIGTPAYMSPEQARGEGRHVDGRADIYALGVVLFELLTSERPFRGSTRMVLHQLLMDDAPSPRNLNATIPRDIETICLKCLEKQPERRYQTAADLIVDLDDCLAGRPIKSRPLGFAGRLVRWAKRKPIVAALSLSLIVAMIAGTTVSIYFAISARNEANKLTASLQEEQRLVNEKTDLLTEKLGLIAELKRSNEQATSLASDKAAVLQFFQEHVLATTRPKGQGGGLGIDVTIRDAVDEAELRIADAFRDQPLVEAALRRTLADTYFYLGQYDQSIAQQESAIQLLTVHKGKEHADTLDASLNLVVAQNAAGNASQALARCQETLRTIENTLGAEHLLSLRASNTLGTTYEKLGRHHEAKALLERVYHDLRDKYGSKHPATLSSMEYLANAYRRTGWIHEAVTLHEQALILAEEIHGVDHASTLSNLHNLAVTYNVAGRTNESISLYLRTIAIKRKTLGNSHPSTVNSLTSLSSLYIQSERLKDSITILKEAQQFVRQSLGPDHPQSFRVARNLAWVFHLDGNSQDGIRILEPMIERAETKYGSDHPETCQFYDDLAVFYEEVGRGDEAIKLRAPKLEQAIKLARSDTTSQLLPVSLLRYGSNLLAQGRFAEAEPICHESMQRYAESQGKKWSHYYAMGIWGECLLGLKRYKEAEQALLESYKSLVAGIHQQPEYTPIRYDHIIESIVRLYYEWDKPAFANKWERDLAEFAEVKQKADSLRKQGQQAADAGNLKDALQFYDEAEQQPWQRESHRRARIYARTLQWERAKEMFKYAFPTSANFQELGLAYRLADMDGYRSTRKALLKDYRYVTYSWNYLQCLQMALLEPLDPENEIPVRFLAAVNENHTDDPASVELIGKAKYRLGEFAEWYQALPADSPLRKGQELLAAIIHFQQDASATKRQKLQDQIELHREQAIVTLYQNIWGSKWSMYFDKIAWVREAQRVLDGSNSVSPDFQWPDTEVDIIEASQKLILSRQSAATLAAEGKPYEAIKAYEEVAKIPGMFPDSQLVRLYARTSQWEAALNTALKLPGTFDWRIPLFLEQLGRDAECRITAAEVLTNEDQRHDPSHLYRLARVAGLVPATDETRDEIRRLADANSPPKVTQRWRCGMVGLLMYRLGEFQTWYAALPKDSPLHHNTELLVALTNFQQQSTIKNQTALHRAIEKSESRIVRLLAVADLGTKWPELISLSSITEEAKRISQSKSLKRPTVNADGPELLSRSQP